MKLTLNNLKKKLGDNYVFLMRQHVVVASRLKIPAEMRHNILTFLTTLAFKINVSE